MTAESKTRLSSYDFRVIRRTKMGRNGQMTPLLLIVLCGACCFLIIHNLRNKFVITIQSENPVYEMHQIIHQQRERIQYLSTHSKVIFRCLDDEPAIKYPRTASDDLTDIVMITNDECGNSSRTDAVLIVHTSVNHFQNRQRFRKAYGNYNHTKPFRLKVVFLIGSTLDANLHIQLERENRDYGDTVIGSYLDTYENLTLKAVSGFRWLANTCSDAKLIIKMDDDVIFDVNKFFTQYWLKIGHDRKQKSLHCLVWHNARVGRTGKWKVERGLFANASYPFSYCAGFFVVITPDLIQQMYMYGKSLDFFWIDDVFLYGMVPEAIKGVHFIQLGGRKNMVAQTHSELDKCRKMFGSNNCPIFASLIEGKSDFELEYTTLLSVKSLIHRNTTNETVVNTTHINIQ